MAKSCAHFVGTGFLRNQIHSLALAWVAKGTWTWQPGSGKIGAPNCRRRAYRLHYEWERSILAILNFHAGLIRRATDVGDHV